MRIVRRAQRAHHGEAVGPGTQGIVKLASGGFNGNMNPSMNLYYGHRFLSEMISHCVWRYFRFALSFRDVEERMAERRVVVSDETIREWCLKLGGAYAKRIRSRSLRPGDRWHLDEVFLRINGQLQYLWRAVD